MLVVTGKIMAANKSKSGKSVSIQVDRTWVSVPTENIDQVKDLIGKGKGIPVRARTELVLNGDGTPKSREFRRKDGTTGAAPDIKVRYWFDAGNSADSDLADLVGIEVEA